jgi:hypothetical protein
MGIDADTQGRDRYKTEATTAHASPKYVALDIA